MFSSIDEETIFCQPRLTPNTILIPNIQDFCIQRKLTPNCRRCRRCNEIKYLKLCIYNKISSRQVRTVLLSNIDFSCTFLNSQLLCQPFSYHWCTCCTIHNCFNLLPSKFNSNCQEGGVSRSTSNGGRRTPYSFPESSSDPNSVIRRCPSSVRAFLLSGSWLGLLVYFRGGVLDTQPYSHSDALWFYLLHLKQGLCFFLLSIWPCGTKSHLSPLFFFLSSDPALSS